MSFSRPIQWYHSDADLIWLDGTIKHKKLYKILVTLMPKEHQKAKKTKFYCFG
jgi:hypothetical protein